MSGTRPDSRWGILEWSNTVPSSSLQDMLIGRTLVDVVQRQMFLRMMNLSDTQRKLNKGTEIATIKPVCAVLNSASAESPTRIIPPHLKSLYKESTTGLTSEECIVVQLLCEYASKGPGDQGCTGLVQHRIHTRNAMPIRQPPRRLPLVKRNETDPAVTEMLQQDIIEPSSSPWCSPVVLVKKKDVALVFA